MRILIAPDKFKGTLTALEAARAIELGLRVAGVKAECTLLPLSDGGEGFVEGLVRATGGRTVPIMTTNVLGKFCRAAWGILGDGKTAVIGLTEASSLASIRGWRRNPGRTSNEGTGRILAEVLAQGFQRVIVGIGGSATNEGGVGLAAPLGFQFLDAEGEPIPLTGDGLASLWEIRRPAKMPKAEIIVATDVTNPLYGPNGAAFQFAKQKGATPAQVRALDRNLRRLARVAEQCLGRSFHDKPGAGAAGGCGYGLMTFLRAKSVPGFELIKDHLGLAELVRSHDLILTGEGTLDATSLHGKAPMRIAQLAARWKKPVGAFCGRIVRQKGLPFTFARGIVSPSVSSYRALSQPHRYLSELVVQTVREKKELFGLEQT